MYENLVLQKTKDSSLNLNKSHQFPCVADRATYLTGNELPALLKDRGLCLVAFP